MKDENKFLSRSRDRERWKRKLSGQLSNAAKAKAIYFRPNLADDRRIRDLAEMMGETKNAIVEKLVVCTLHNSAFITKKLTEQKNSFRRLEDNTETVVNASVEILTLLEDIRRRNLTHERLTNSLLGEIYCMVHTAVSLMRTVLLQILGLTQKETSNTQLSPEVLTSFDQTSDLTIVRSLQDLESAADFHQIESGKFNRENLFWQSKLRISRSESKEK